MNNAVLIVYWTIFCICAIIIQQHISGVDALVPGLLIALQARKRALVVWFFILFCLIQEGAGSMHFGTGILWYSGVIILYFLGSRVVLGTTFVAVLLLSGLFSAYFGFLSVFAYTIQDCMVEYQVLIRHCVTEAVMIPVIWLLAAPLRYRMITNGSD